MPGRGLASGHAKTPRRGSRPLTALAAAAKEEQLAQHDDPTLSAERDRGGTPRQRAVYSVARGHGGCFAGRVRIERFDPAGDEATRRALYDVYAEGAPVDDPAGPVMSYGVYGGWLIHGWTAEPRETWLATDGAGGTVGGYVLGLPDRENRDQGGLEIQVAPGRGRSRVGTVLLRHAAERARMNGRSTLAADTKD